ncbi:hypothetical protein ACHAWF_011332 [Thalassiosira exigua]
MGAHIASARHSLDEEEARGTSRGKEGFFGPNPMAPVPGLVLRRNQIWRYKINASHFLTCVASQVIFAKNTMMPGARVELDVNWRRIAGHLAKLFLDYEPGIHYPQLQMQAGTTGINAMRVYNVTKQGKDQDPEGIFIRKYVLELRNVPNEYIHEPHTMPASAQKKCQVFIDGGNSKGISAGLGSIFEPINHSARNSDVNDKKERSSYPYPIIDEKASAKAAKDKLSAVRKQETTKLEAQQVFLKHGSRRSRDAGRDGAKPKAFSKTVKRVKVEGGQSTLLNSWKYLSQDQSECCDPKDNLSVVHHTNGVQNALCEGNSENTRECAMLSPVAKPLRQREVPDTGTVETQQWSCRMCTFLNQKPMALACSMCGSERR